MTDNKIVKKKSKAYGYNYTSLADIAKDGYEIPKMRVKPTECGEYIEYLDEKGEWQIGAKVVVPTMKGGANEAQAYGSALSYARRYTTLLALQLVSDDDKKIETQAPEESRKKIDFNAVRKNIKESKTVSEVEEIWEEIPTHLRQYFVTDASNKKRELING